MKAAVLKSFGSPLAIEKAPDPVLGTGEVIVDVVATRVLSYMNEVFSGMRNYALDLPIIPGPGGIGRVRAIGPDATKLSVGDWVFCDPTVRSRDEIVAPDIALQGLTAAGPGGMLLQKHFRHGSFAEQMRVPTENVKRLGQITSDEATQWCALGTLLVPYGGFLAANLQPGETVLVSGATGNFGSAAVSVALAMGAACVVAPGRNDKILADLVGRFGDRVRPVKLTGNEDDDCENMKRAAPGPDRLRVRHHAALGEHDRRARGDHDGARLRPRRADGWRRHGGRRGPRAALPLDHAQLHQHPRRLDVPA
ncbi:NADPH:quinone reductase-like Zn-dependent oxidoreductase [Bradyrhizobium sp. LM3.4]